MSKFLIKKNRDILSRLSNMKRFNNSIHMHDENVAEHSFYVALYSMEICNILRINGELRSVIIERALIHDVHEIELSDIPHDVKAKNSEILDFCLKFEEDYNNKNFPKIMARQDDLRHELDFIQNVVELADIISVKQYSLQECEFGNRKKFLPILYDTEKRINKIINYLYSVVDAELVKELENNIKE